MHEDRELWLAKWATDGQRAGRAPSLILGWSGDSPPTSVIWGAGDVPGDPADTQYRIGSITKTFTAAVVMRLAKAGAVELDRPLSQSVPGLSGSRATLRDVLADTAGIRENPDGPWWELGFSRSSRELFAGGMEALMTAPSTYGSHHYSNLGYALVGWVLEQTTGQAWETLVSEQLLGPLGLTRTTLMPSAPYAVGHVVDPWQETTRSVPLSDTAGMAPAGQLWSSVGDLLRWGRCLLGETEAVLSRDIVEEMRRPRVMSDEHWRGGHGAGLQLWRDQELMYAGHGGSVPGFCAALVTHRPTGHVVAVCANSSSLAATDPVSLALDAMREAVVSWPAAHVPWRPESAPTGRRPQAHGPMVDDDLRVRGDL